MNLCQTLITIGSKHGNIDVNEIMPSRVTVSNNVQNKYQILKEKFIERAEKINFFGITLDL